MKDLMDEISKHFDEVIKFRHTLNQETDRGCALMSAAFLDSELTALLKSKLIYDKAIFNSLFAHSGPLGTFSAKIDLAYSIGLIGKKAHRDLHIIRKLRNDFAHLSEPITFEHVSMRKRCQELYHDASGVKVRPRAKFTRVVCGVLAVIHFSKFTTNNFIEFKDIKIDGRLKAVHRQFTKKLLDEIKTIKKLK